MRYRARASAAGPSRCRATCLGYLNRAANIVGSPDWRGIRPLSTFCYVTFGKAFPLWDTGISLERHIIENATFDDRVIERGVGDADLQIVWRDFGRHAGQKCEQ